LCFLGPGEASLTAQVSLVLVSVSLEEVAVQLAELKQGMLRLGVRGDLEVSDKVVNDTLFDGQEPAPPLVGIPWSITAQTEALIAGQWFRLLASCCLRCSEISIHFHIAATITGAGGQKLTPRKDFSKKFSTGY
jgi:hypothetical protein